MGNGKVWKSTEKNNKMSNNPAIVSQNIWLKINNIESSRRSMQMSDVLID